MARPRRSLRERLLAPVTIDSASGCWIRQGHKVDGYTQVSEGGAQSRKLRAHRVAYELFVGPIPEGMQLDHLCRNRACVNPEHLEVVTGRENTLRGTSFAAANAAKTECVHGHSLADAYITTKGRKCRVCSAASAAKWRAKNREHKRRYDRAWRARMAAT